MSEVVRIQTQPKPKLPEEFLSYVNKKLGEKGRRGRPHLITQLGSLERVLELLKDAWIDNLNLNQLSQKYGVSKPTIWRFLNECKIYRDQIIAYITYFEEVKPRDFRSFPIVQEWEKKIRRSGHLSSLRNIPIMANVCGYRYLKYQKPYVKGWRCNPERFDLKKAQEFVDKYLEQHPNKTKIPQHISRAIRSFLMVAKEIGRAHV